MIIIIIEKKKSSYVCKSYTSLKLRAFRQYSKVLPITELAKYSEKWPITQSRHAHLSRHQANFFDVSRITSWKNGLIMPSRHAHFSRHHANYFAVSRITSCKTGQSHHHANVWGYLIKNKSKNKLFCETILPKMSLKKGLKKLGI